MPRKDSAEPDPSRLVLPAKQFGLGTGLLALLRRSIPGGSRLSRRAPLLREISLLEITMQLRRDQRARNRFPNQAFSNRWVLEIEDVVTLFCGYVLFVNFYPKRELR